MLPITAQRPPGAATLASVYTNPAKTHRTLEAHRNRGSHQAQIVDGNLADHHGQAAYVSRSDEGPEHGPQHSDDLSRPDDFSQRGRKPRRGEQTKIHGPQRLGMYYNNLNVGQDLRQGRALARMLLDVFFTAVLNTAESMFMRDPVVVADRLSVSKTDKRVAGGETIRGDGPQENILWSTILIHADDAGIVPRWATSLVKMMTTMVKACDGFGLIVSEEKTKTMLF